MLLGRAITRPLGIGKCVAPLVRTGGDSFSRTQSRRPGSNKTGEGTRSFVTTIRWNMRKGVNIHVVELSLLCTPGCDVILSCLVT
jgi:hypothetical protein